MIKNKNDFKPFTSSNQTGENLIKSNLTFPEAVCRCCNGHSDKKYNSLHKQPFGNEKPVVESSRQRIFEISLLDYKEAAQYLRVSGSYLRRLKMKGGIPFVSMGIRGVRFKIASLDLWIAAREVKK